MLFGWFPGSIRQSATFLLFVGDLNRAEKEPSLHTDTFNLKGVEVLIPLDAACWANTLLAAESGYGGVIIRFGPLQVRKK